MVRGAKRSALLRGATKNAPSLDACIDKLRAIQSRSTFMAHYVHALADTEQKCRTLLEAEAIIKGSENTTARIGKYQSKPPAVMPSRSAAPAMQDARYQCSRHGVYGDEDTVPVDRAVIQQLDKCLAAFVHKMKGVMDGVAMSRRSTRELLIALMESRGAAVEERRRILDSNSRLRAALRTANTTRPNVYLFGQSPIRNSWGVSVAQSSVEEQRGVAPPTPLKGRAEISVQSYNRKKKKKKKSRVAKAKKSTGSDTDTEDDVRARS